jgi:hypothetical protein
VFGLCMVTHIAEKFFDFSCVLFFELSLWQLAKM